MYIKNRIKTSTANFAGRTLRDAINETGKIDTKDVIIYTPD